MRIALLPLLATVTLLSGCSTFYSSPDPEPKSTVSWDQHFRQLKALESWTASGKVAITVKDKVQTAKIIWNQNDLTFDIQFIAPLGQSGPKIVGNEQKVTLLIPKEQPLTGTSTSEVLQKRLGWQLPVENAKYWIKGIPSPIKESDVVLDNEKLTLLKQDGWKIKYNRYTKINDLTLPSKITITRGQLKFLLVIYNWKVSSDSNISL